MLKKTFKNIYPVLTFSACSAFCFSAFASNSSPANIYTMADLEILEKEKNYQEFFEHASDIRPINRTSYWHSMLENMSEGYTSNVLKMQIIDDKTFQYVESLHALPALQDNEFFMRNRDKIAIKYFERCFAKKMGDCKQMIIHFWQKDQRNGETGVKLGNLLRKYEPIPLNQLWSFLKPAVQGNLSKFHCKNDDISKIVIEKLISMASVNTTPNKLRFKIDDNISGACWEEIRSQLKTSIQSSNNEKRKTIYYLLSCKGELSQEEKDLYHLVFLLDSPGRGELLNRSWNTISSLGKDYLRRSKVLKKIKTLDPLPGALFSSFDAKKRDTIIKHLHNNIPEYLDYYGKTCVEYLEGKGQFPNGNPTLECKELFNLSQDTNLVDPWLQTRFKKIKLL